MKTPRLPADRKFLNFTVKTQVSVEPFDNEPEGFATEAFENDESVAYIYKDKLHITKREWDPEGLYKLIRFMEREHEKTKDLELPKK